MNPEMKSNTPIYYLCDTVKHSPQGNDCFSETCIYFIASCLCYCMYLNMMGLSALKTIPRKSRAFLQDESTVWNCTEKNLDYL